MSKVQDDEVGDGTTSVVVLASELLREAEQLISQKLHPQTIISGWRKACEEAASAIKQSARFIGNEVPATFENELMDIAKTTLSSNLPRLMIIEEQLVICQAGYLGWPGLANNQIVFRWNGRIWKVRINLKWK